MEKQRGKYIVKYTLIKQSTQHNSDRQEMDIRNKTTVIVHENITVTQD